MITPPGFGTMFPYIFASDAKNYIVFLSLAFGAEEIQRTETATGNIANAIVKIGTTMFMVSEASEQFKSSRSSYYIYVENADAAFAKALAEGAEKIFEPMDMPYKDRQGGVIDINGNIWWISQRLVEGPYA